MNKDILARLESLENKSDNLKEFRPLSPYIDKGACYDDLTDDLKGLYCRYMGYDREQYETMLLSFWGDLKDTLDYKVPDNLDFKPTKEQIAEIEDLMENL